MRRLGCMVAGIVAAQGCSGVPQSHGDATLVRGHSTTAYLLKFPPLTLADGHYSAVVEQPPSRSYVLCLATATSLSSLREGAIRVRLVDTATGETVQEQGGPVQTTWLQAARVQEIPEALLSPAAEPGFGGKLSASKTYRLEIDLSGLPRAVGGATPYLWTGSKWGD